MPTKPLAKFLGAAMVAMTIVGAAIADHRGMTFPQTVLMCVLVGLGFVCLWLLSWVLLAMIQLPFLLRQDRLRRERHEPEMPNLEWAAEQARRHLRENPRPRSD